jgi:putative oxidoreductase
MSGQETDGREQLREWGLLALRAALAVIFMAHGAQKLFGWFGGYGFAGTVQFFTTQMGVPAPLAVLAILTEFFGGLAVLLGVLSRTAALGLAVVMVVAALKVHLANGFFLAAGPGQANGIEYNVALFGMAVALALTGPGRFALAGDTEWRLKDLFGGAPRHRRVQA